MNDAETSTPPAPTAAAAAPASSPTPEAPTPPADNLTFADLWHLEVFSAGDTAVQLNQLVIALVVMVLGLLLARLIAKLVGHRLIAGGRFNRATAFVLQRVVNLSLAAVAVFIALPIAGIPITIFTVFGGALAIGVGFGAQNLINNFISGFILMVEQPIRVGDIVELDGREGYVEAISNRCVRVRRTDGVDLLVPNSHFLEQVVVNWTLSDANVRGEVVVGIAYGSETERARDLILEAVNAHPKVLQEPRPPTVLFEEFGDNSLNFRLLFWSSVTRPMDLRQICSDLRYRIDAMFRAADIVIAFPQRDIHLDTLKPLEVRVSSTPV